MAVVANKALTVFPDANVIIRMGKPPGGPLFHRLADLVKAGFITILTTDLTKDEIIKKHVENDYEVVKEFGRPHFRKLIEGLCGVPVPQIDKAELKSRLWKQHADGVAKMFVALKAKTLSIDDVKPSAVLDAYTHRTGLFTGEGKKDQFPDAFILERVRAEASSSAPIILVADDKDFKVAVKDSDNLSVLKTIEDLFKMLGLQVEIPEIDDFLDEQKDTVIELFDAELKNWILDATDVEDADIEVLSVESVKADDIISFGTVGAGNEIIVVGNATIKATVSYTHPDWDTAIYDSEDKTLTPWNDDVSGETTVDVDVEFSMSIEVDKQGEPSKIKEISLTDDSGLYVELHSPYDYK